MHVGSGPAPSARVDSAWLGGIPNRCLRPWVARSIDPEFPASPANRRGPMLIAGALPAVLMQRPEAFLLHQITPLLHRRTHRPGPITGLPPVASRFVGFS